MGFRVRIRGVARLISGEWTNMRTNPRADQSDARIPLACTCWRGSERSATLCPACASFSLKRADLAPIYDAIKFARQSREERERAARRERRNA